MGSCVSGDVVDGLTGRSVTLGAAAGSRVLTDRSVSSVGEPRSMSSPRPQRRSTARHASASRSHRSREVGAATGRGGGRDRILAAALRRCSGPAASATCRCRTSRKAAGVTKAALYYHFTDKADLYTTVALQRIALDPRGDGRGRGRGRDARGAAPAAGDRRLRADASGRLRAAPPCPRAPRRRAPPAAPQGDGRAPGAGHPLLRGGRARPTRSSAPQGGVGAAGRGPVLAHLRARTTATPTARCRRTGSSGRRSRSACSCGGYWSLARGEDQHA